MVYFLKFEIEQITTERLEKLTKYYNLEVVGIEEDLIILRARTPE